jgi:hypothetical protein
LELDSAFNQATVSYNGFFSGDITTVIDVDEFLEQICFPTTYPHISIYYPLNALFQVYDAIVVAHKTNDNRDIFGFQLKEGKALPESEPAKAFGKSYVIRGKAHARNSKPSASFSQWIIPTEPEIKQFYGVSGEKWVPREWEKLLESEKKSRKRKMDEPGSTTKKAKIRCCKCSSGECKSCACQQKRQKCTSCPSPNCANI